jgi:hypothetical protein
LPARHIFRVPDFGFRVSGFGFGADCLCELRLFFFWGGRGFRNCLQRVATYARELVEVGGAQTHTDEGPVLEAHTDQTLEGHTDQTRGAECRWSIETTGGSPVSLKTPVAADPPVTPVAADPPQDTCRCGSSLPVSLKTAVAADPPVSLHPPVSLEKAVSLETPLSPETDPAGLSQLLASTPLSPNGLPRTFDGLPRTSDDMSLTYLTPLELSLCGPTRVFVCAPPPPSPSRTRTCPQHLSVVSVTPQKHRGVGVGIGVCADVGVGVGVGADVDVDERSSVCTEVLISDPNP